MFIFFQTFGCSKKNIIWKWYDILFPCEFIWNNCSTVFIHLARVSLAVIVFSGYILIGWYDKDKHASFERAAPLLPAWFCFISCLSHVAWFICWNLHPLKCDIHVNTAGYQGFTVEYDDNWPASWDSEATRFVLVKQITKKSNLVECQ